MRASGLVRRDADSKGYPNMKFFMKNYAQVRKLLASASRPSNGRSSRPFHRSHQTHWEGQYLKEGDPNQYHPPSRNAQPYPALVWEVTIGRALLTLIRSTKHRARNAPPKDQHTQTMRDLSLQSHHDLAA
jgi:hypothetical protein